MPYKKLRYDEDIISEMKKRKQDFRPLLKEAVMFLLGGGLGAILLICSWQWIGRKTIFPGVRVAGVGVGGMQKEQAIADLEEKISQLEVKIRYGESSWGVPRQMFQLEPERTVEKAMKIGKKWSPEIMKQLWTGKIELPLMGSLKAEEWLGWQAEIEGVVSIPSQVAKLKVVNGKYQLINGEDGVEVNFDKLKGLVVRAVTTLDPGEIELPVENVRMRLNPEEITRANQVLEELLDKKLEIVIEDKVVTLQTPELISFISLSPERLGEVEQESVSNYVGGLAERYNRVPQNARFVFENGRVKEFAAGKEGINLQTEKTAESLEGAIEQLVKGETDIKIEAELEKTPPKIATGEVNDLGIVELIGKGESYYAHSITNRIFNVELAAARINGVLVPPGEEFSFNQEVGEITGATGYKTAYVIANGRTELGDGGGVCQVSTTLFRAVMAAGLPISERWAHAYRVGYYEQNSEPGFDATVYAPSKDFKFRNDTPGYILIQTINDPANKHLIFELYGTSDGREATTSKARVSGVTPPPPDLYQDDPTLPAGEVRQVDWSAWGAKVVFDYKVLREGEIIFAKTYVSNYRPWQNVFLRGTGE